MKNVKLVEPISRFEGIENVFLRNFAEIRNKLKKIEVKTTKYE